MRIAFVAGIFCLILNSSACSRHEYNIDESKLFQTVRGFGASDAWSNERVNLLSDSDRNIASDWLFSNEMNPDGSSRGIGLSIWRYNLGAGSSEQGDSSGIGDPHRRTECFLSPGGNWDFTRQSGTQWLVRAAKTRGVENLVMFCNSPPVSLTLNGKAFAQKCGETNLAPERFNDFADFITRSLQYFDGGKIHFDYVSPVNESEWAWCRRDGQEGNPYTNIQIAGLVQAINRKLIENQISTQIQIPESGLLVFANPGFKPGRQNEIINFFHQGKNSYIGDQPQVARQVCAHSYFTEWPLPVMRVVRKRLARTAERHGVEYWMTEYCILRKTREIEGGGRDLGMHTALFVARVIHHDLVYGNAAAWCCYRPDI